MIGIDTSGHAESNGGGGELRRAATAGDWAQQPRTIQRSIGRKLAPLGNGCRSDFEERAVRDKIQRRCGPNSERTSRLEAALSTASRPSYGGLRPFSGDVDGVEISGVS